MFKRFTNKQLSIVLGALCVFYLGALAFGGKADRTFKKTLSSLDTAKVNKVIMTPSTGDPVTLVKNGPAWNVQLAGGGMAPTGDNLVKSALGSIAVLEAKQLMSRDEDDWGEYKVDTAGTRVQVMEGEAQALDLVVGKFEYKQTGMMTYVRPYDEEETYMVPGFLQSTFARKIDDWRNKVILKGSTSEWSAVRFSYPADSSFQLAKGPNNTWILPDSTELNTSEVNSYLSSIANTNGTSFVETAPSVSTPAFQLAIQSSSAGMIEVKAYPDPTHGYILNSSLNPTSYFVGDETLISKLFVGKSKFEKTEE